MASPGNRHCASCIGTLSFAIQYVASPLSGVVWRLQRLLTEPVQCHIDTTHHLHAAIAARPSLCNINQQLCYTLGEISAGLMPTEARGNYMYLPEPPYLRETKTYHSQPLESTRHAGNYFVPISIRPIFIFFVAEVMSNYLTTDGLKKFSLLPEACGICHICHMVNPALPKNIL